MIMILFIYLLNYFAVNTSGMVFPSHQITNIGETAKFTCLSSSKVSWYFQDNPKLPQNVESINKGLHPKILIDKVNIRNDGKYSCMGRKDNHVFIGFGILVVQSKCYH